MYQKQVQPQKKKKKKKKKNRTLLNSCITKALSQLKCLN